jgi:hypothetical protein
MQFEILRGGVPMPVEDKLIAMHARHALAKTPTDISELVISCSRGVIEMNGKVKKPRNYTGHIDLHKEFRTMIGVARGAQGVKDVVADRVELVE